MPDMNCRLLVIGAGPGGYVCAIRASQLGVDTVVVDAARPGGTCLNIGCIPSKALIHAAEQFHTVRLAARESPIGISLADPRIDLVQTVAWKDGIVSRLTGGVSGLLKKARVKVLTGAARFVDGKTVIVEMDTGKQTIRAETIVIATGSVPVELPSLPFGGPVISSTEALSLDAVPERLAVVGGGYIGLEIGTTYAKLGAKVTVVESASRILPLYDADLVRPVEKRLEELGVEVLTGAKASGYDETSKALNVEVADGGQRKIPTDKVLVAVGRKPRTGGWGFEELQLAMDGPFVRIDKKCCTSMRSVYAIGDLTGEPMLAHRAMAQGEMVAEIAAGKKRQWDKACIPAICFTDPEIVSVGLSPDQANAAGYETTVATFPFKANGRAMTMEDDSGFVRMVCRADNHLVLGIQAVGAGVSELATAFGLAIETGCVAEDVTGTIHAHPTRGEALQEAALGALGHALHC